MRRLSTLLFALPLLAAAPAVLVEHTIANDLKGGYQVVAADLNHDGRPDLIALASGLTELVWYENPGWQRHVLASGQSRMINCVVVGNEIVLASAFANQAKDSIGIVSVLHPGDDPREPWTVTEIDRLTTSHRLRTADIDGSGTSGRDQRRRSPAPPPPRPTTATRRRSSTTSPASGNAASSAPRIPAWSTESSSPIGTATAARISSPPASPAFTSSATRRTLAGRAPKSPKAILPRGRNPAPAISPSDISPKTRFLAAIEPWHGNQVAVYTQRGAQWEREVIDTTLVDGHTIQAADLNGDGVDEIIAGFRGQPRSVYLYSYDAAAKSWTRSDLDKGGMGAAACTVIDLNKDGRPDIACIDSTRLKWYENRPAHLHQSEPRP